MINAVLGDASFVARFGRRPHAGDDPALRVATHLRYVVAGLRARGRRGALLDAFDAYIAAGVFPTNPDRGYRPVFVDRQSGARCAVGHLIEQTESAAVALAIDRAHHHAYLAELGDVLAPWATHYGFTLAELAAIQPQYPYHPPPPVDVRITAAGEVDGGARGLALAGAGIAIVAPHDQSFYNCGFVALDAAAGATTTNHEVAFAAELRLGREIGFWQEYKDPGNLGRFDVGLRVDRWGDAVPTALSLAIGGDVDYGVTDHNWLGIGGELRIAPIDRDWFGAAVAVGYTRRELVGRLGARIGVDATRVEGRTFVGVTLGVVTAPTKPRFGL